jgi:hypothetical protein
VRKLFAAFLILLLFLPSWAAAQDGELEQKYADEEFSFGYPMGWIAIPTSYGVMVRLRVSLPVSENAPDVLMLTFFKTTVSNEAIASWPLDSDLVFLLGYITCEAVSGILEEGEYAEYGEIEKSTINENELVLITFEGQEMSGVVAAIEHDAQRLIAIAFGTTQTLREQGGTVRRIIQSVEFKN